MAETGQSIKPTDLRPGSEGYQEYITGEHWFENQGKEAPQSASSIETAIGNAITPLRTEISQVTGKVEEMTRQLEVVANLQGQVAELQKQVAVIPQLQEEVRLLREQLTSQVTSTEKTEAQKPKTKAAATSIPNEEEIQKDIADGIYTEADIQLKDGSRRVAPGELARRVKRFRAAAVQAVQQRQEAAQPEPPQTEVAPAAEKLAEDDEIGPQSEAQEPAEPTPDAAGEEMPEDEEAGEQKEKPKEPTVVHAGDFLKLYGTATTNNPEAYKRLRDLYDNDRLSFDNFHAKLQEECNVQFQDYRKTEMSAQQTAWRDTITERAQELRVSLSAEQISEIADQMLQQGGDYTAAIRQATASAREQPPTQAASPISEARVDSAVNTAQTNTPASTEHAQPAAPPAENAGANTNVDAVTPDYEGQLFDIENGLSLAQKDALEQAGINTITVEEYNEFMRRQIFDSRAGKPSRSIADYIQKIRGLAPESEETGTESTESMSPTEVEANNIKTAGCLSKLRGLLLWPERAMLLQRFAREHPKVTVGTGLAVLAGYGFLRENPELAQMLSEQTAPYIQQVTALGQRALDLGLGALSAHPNIIRDVSVEIASGFHHLPFIQDLLEKSPQYLAGEPVMRDFFGFVLDHLHDNTLNLADPQIRAEYVQRLAATGQVYGNVVKEAISQGVAGGKELAGNFLQGLQSAIKPEQLEQIQKWLGTSPKPANIS